MTENTNQFKRKRKKLIADTLPKITIKDMADLGLFKPDPTGNYYYNFHLLYKNSYLPIYTDFVISQIWIEEKDVSFEDDEDKDSKVFKEKVGYLDFKEKYTITFKKFLTGEVTKEELIKNMDGEGHKFVRSIELVNTRGTTGGERFWFHCPRKNCKKCRVSTLYLVNDEFGCQKCFDLTYKSSNITSSRRAVGSLGPISKIEKLQKETRTFSYKNKPTKRYTRLKKKIEKFNRYIDSLEMGKI